MFSLFEGMAGGPKNWILGWVLPAAVACSAVGYFLVPHYPDAPLPSDAGDRALVLLGAILLVAVSLSALSTLLFQGLEGYLWPRRVREWRIRVHGTKLDKISEKVDVADKSAADHNEISAIEAALDLERMYRYPVDRAQIAPSRLGNTIRAFETYGYDRYRLDSQSLWDELITVIPEALRQEEADARTPVNFFVALIWLDAAYTLASLATGLTRGWDGGLVASLAMGLVLLLPIYSSAIRSCAGWGQAVRAVVNLGRKPLASALGLRMPRTIAAEREMWESFGSFVADSFEADSARDLNRWRLPPEGSSGRKG